MKRLINGVLSKITGYEIRNTYDRSSFEEILRNLKKNGISPVTIIDVGAASGTWSEKVKSVFPDAEYELFEPLAEFTPDIGTLHRQAVSDKNGTTKIYVHSDLVGSSLMKEVEEYVQSTSIEREIETVTLDSFPFKAPCILKLDVQGHEKQALLGATESLKRTEAVFMEMSTFSGFEEGDEFADMVVFMKEHGFVLYDIIGSFLYRPYDNALCQLDAVFVPEGSSLRAYHGYATKEQRVAHNENYTRG